MSSLTSILATTAPDLPCCWGLGERKEAKKKKRKKRKKTKNEPIQLNKVIFDQTKGMTQQTIGFLRFLLLNFFLNE